MSSQTPERFRSEYQAGRYAFERGRYREAIAHLEAAREEVARQSRLGGEVQMWLVSAYQAAGLRQEAIALCRELSRHPSFETRKQGRRLLYILEAPELTTRPDWLVKIPDLSEMEQGESKVSQLSAEAVAKRRPPKQQQREEPPIDWSEVNTEDNRFIWIAIAAIVLLLGIWAGWS
ncbi:tetratricopeptide repeat protein [Oxynema sp. CENA135]|uniref:tetratricopeptide repeat protein n=1 Tax=Oxynema sp. CENA135 TaxID=984206 RepID=UPI00190BFE69|nr:tetratricopeptide repeat protein [Oxynema sp. CENA135]